MSTLSCVLLLGLASNADAGNDDAATLQTIRAAVRENFTAINSLELRFHTYDPTTKTEFPAREWAIDGDKFLITSYGTERGGVEQRKWLSFDGKMSYSIDYDPDNLAQVRSIQRSSSRMHFNYEASVMPLQLFGWRLLGSDETLLALLNSPRARLFGREDIEEHSCWKVDLGENSYKGRSTNRLTAWFDPAASYWMRKLSIVPIIVPRDDKQPVMLYDGQMYSEYVATDFGRFDDLALGGQRWFPTRYRITGLQRSLVLILNDIKINHPIDGARFTPDIPVGTLLIDEPGTPDQVTHYAGGDAGYDAYKKKLLADAAVMSKSGPGSPLIDAQKDGLIQWTSILSVVSVLVVLAGCGIWWKARARG